jgi:hypothetical protein
LILYRGGDEGIESVEDIRNIEAETHYVLIVLFREFIREFTLDSDNSQSTDPHDASSYIHVSDIILTSRIE